VVDSYDQPGSIIITTAHASLFLSPPTCPWRSALRTDLCNQTCVQPHMEGEHPDSASRTHFPRVSSVLRSSSPSNTEKTFRVGSAPQRELQTCAYRAARSAAPLSKAERGGGARAVTAPDALSSSGSALPPPPRPLRRRPSSATALPGPIHPLHRERGGQRGISNGGRFSSPFYLLPILGPLIQ
jgi:hypothetical protein